MSKTLYYYHVRKGQLKEAAVTSETDKTFILKQTTEDFITRVIKNDHPGGYMRTGDCYFFMDKTAAIESLKKLCQLRIAELARWQKLLEELEAKNE